MRGPRLRDPRVDGEGLLCRLGAKWVLLVAHRQQPVTDWYSAERRGVYAARRAANLSRSPGLRLEEMRRDTKPRKVAI
jgi:hypothetical protein